MEEDEEPDWDEFNQWGRENDAPAESENQDMGQDEALDGMLAPSFEQLKAESDAHNKKIEDANRAAQAARVQAAQDLR